MKIGEFYNAAKYYTSHDLNKSMDVPFFIAPAPFYRLKDVIRRVIKADTLEAKHQVTLPPIWLCLERESDFEHKATLSKHTLGSLGDKFYDLFPDPVTFLRSVARYTDNNDNETIKLSIDGYEIQLTYSKEKQSGISVPLHAIKYIESPNGCKPEHNEIFQTYIRFVVDQFINHYSELLLRGDDYYKHLCVPVHQRASVVKTANCHRDIAPRDKERYFYNYTPSELELLDNTEHGEPTPFSYNEFETFSKALSDEISDRIWGNCYEPINNCFHFITGQDNTLNKDDPKAFVKHIKTHSKQTKAIISPCVSVAPIPTDDTRCYIQIDTSSNYLSEMARTVLNLALHLKQKGIKVSIPLHANLMDLARGETLTWIHPLSMHHDYTRLGKPSEISGTYIAMQKPYDKDKLNETVSELVPLNTRY